MARNFNMKSYDRKNSCPEHSAEFSFSRSTFKKQYIFNNFNRIFQKMLIVVIGLMICIAKFRLFLTAFSQHLLLSKAL